MTVWRLARAVYPALDGEGARLNGGRWNEPGTPIVYTAGSLSLAALDVLVHLNPDRLPDDLVAYGIALPTESLQARRVETTELPERVGPSGRGSGASPDRGDVGARARDAYFGRTIRRHSGGAQLPDQPALRSRSECAH